MNVQARRPILSSFQVRAFIMQSPADLLTNIGIELEMLVLGWFIRTETKSVRPLTVFGFLATLMIVLW